MDDTGSKVRDGIVYISELDDSPTPAFHCHWESGDASGPFLVEQGPRYARAEDAIAWGRERADVVLIRVGPLPQKYYSAGTRLPPCEELPIWPPRPAE